MAKQTLIFDASVIAENLGNGRGRSGIYFATYNILRGLIDSGEFDVSLYSGADNFDFVDFVKREFGDDIKIYFTNKYALFLSKMIRLDKELRAKKRNISKLLLNIFVRKPIIFFGRNVKMPQFDVAFSYHVVL